jgi:hypothetical protein
MHVRAPECLPPQSGTGDSQCLQIACEVSPRARTSERRAQARRLVKNSIISVEQPDEELEEDEWADEAGAAAEAVAAARAAGGAGAGGAAGAGRSP